MSNNLKLNWRKVFSPASEEYSASVVVDKKFMPTSFSAVKRPWGWIAENGGSMIRPAKSKEDAQEACEEFFFAIARAANEILKDERQNND